LAKSLASGEEGGNFLVQRIFTCLRYTKRRGGGVGALWSGVKRWPLGAGYVLVYLRIKGVSQQI
jgi:hypothetical protein